MADPILEHQEDVNEKLNGVDVKIMGDLIGFSV
jgi:hypothetical protein